ncbi:NADPH-dependent 7-cyano-7-deazaguanine reductase QueF [Pelovirga terrestris]|uniref:NADPH-dependent 7-cyano-7-deazaguanine reductase QueF n=1 Tax=Pelovirga terrestris TaxID=2771352 RepID=A0A8J6QVC7_9BACT|nr:NADPH-dependent 7-cyano-7-deazaguanine reductase QueF [Pelovirga terrestris]MBD1401540.1 NADPH-dependent 7-cyano-7-deazaguanine reductase QueF [Pelovirga terrestris]
MSDLEQRLPLGKPTRYQDSYDPTLLCPFARHIKRDEIGLGKELPFGGFDLWTGYELSWLNRKGKPVVAVGEFRFACDTPYLIESKSFKLYLNSFNQTPYPDVAAVTEQMREDLSRASGGEVKVQLWGVEDFSRLQIGMLPGDCIDDLDIEIDDYQLNPGVLLGASDTKCPVKEQLHSHLLKSNCLVTSQPDWGSVLIRYQGGRIDREALLRYLISFRRHNEFHEQCVERIFTDLLRFCRPQKLTVYARYTRRGGLDINPFRSNFEEDIDSIRLVRQ